MNFTDVRRHIGIVDASFHDLSISVVVPALNHETALPDVLPEFTTPLRWRPREGDSVVIYERLPALRPELALTWGGWASDPEDVHLVPPWLAPGCVHLLSEDGHVLVALEDDEPELLDAAGNPTPRTAAIRIGRRDAAEPLLIGTVYRGWMEATVDLVRDLVDALNTLNSARAAVRTAEQVKLTAEGVWVNAHPANPAAITTYASAVTAYATAVGTYQTAVAAFETSLATIRTALVGPTTPIPDQDQRTLIADHLSQYVFTSRAREVAA